jgi:hypothetical protein
MPKRFTCWLILSFIALSALCGAVCWACGFKLPPALFTAGFGSWFVATIATHRADHVEN